MKRLLVVSVLAAGSAAVLAGTGTGADDTPAKVFVCKYVGTPGIDERLQTGDNPISVSTNAIPLGDVHVGSEFADAQGRSRVVAFDTGQPEPDCPTPHGGTTTTTEVKSSTTTTTCPDCVPNTQGATTTTTPTTTTPATSSSAASTTSSSAAPTTTNSSPPSTSTTSTPSATTSSSLPAASSTTTTTTLPETFTFGAATTVCRAEVPTIVITFQNLFPQLAGMTGTLTMSDADGNLVSTQPLVYAPGTTVELLYPGTTVNPDGTIADVPGWILQPNGLWVRDPSDEFLRDGIQLTYTVNPTATAFVTYPPETSACANPDGPFPPTPQQLPATR